MKNSSARKPAASPKKSSPPIKEPEAAAGACEDLFLDCEDEMTQMHPGEWDCDDDFEYVDADYVHPVSASGAPSEGFNPNDEDSIREHYVLRPEAEWCTNGTPHPMLTWLLQGRSRRRPKMWQLPWYHQVAPDICVATSPDCRHASGAMLRRWVAIHGAPATENPLISASDPTTKSMAKR